MKKIFGIFIIVSLSYACTYAGNDDCAFVPDYQQSILETKTYEETMKNYWGSNYSAVYPAEAVRVAVFNLQKQCCKNKLIPSDKLGTVCKNIDTSRGFPESPFFFDQLLDVGLRRLDAMPEDALRYGLAPDPTGKERRDYITKIGEDKNGVPSKGIIENYKKFWTAKMLLPLEIDKDNLSVYQKAIQEYNSVEKTSLRDKYMNICIIVSTIYDKMKKNPALETETFTNKCVALVEERIHQEYILTQALIIKKSNELLLETNKAYLQNYFVQEKIVEMMNLVTKIKSLYATMVQQGAASKTCTK